MDSSSNRTHMADVKKVEDKKPEGGDRRGGDKRDDRKKGGRPQRGNKRFEQEREFDQRILDLARVTRVTKGGKRMRFRACVIIGDGKGRVAQGVAKGLDVATAVNKAVTQAKKNFITVPIINETLPHAELVKFGAAQVLLKPAPKGTGIKAGGAVRTVLELAGVPNATAKMLGGKNKLNNAKATILALSNMMKIEPPAKEETAKVKKEKVVKA